MPQENIKENIAIIYENVIAIIKTYQIGNTLSRISHSNISKCTQLYTISILTAQKMDHQHV